MRLYTRDGAAFGTVVHIGSEPNGGIWAAGTFDPVPFHSRLYRTPRDSELLFAFYIKVSPSSRFEYNPPHIWGLSYGMSQDFLCVYDMPFNARRARTSRQLYSIGALEMIKRWFKLEPTGCTPAPPPSTARLGTGEEQRKAVLDLIHTYIEPLDYAFHGA